eukprot:224047-Chlamydomonas_euryale.AAC.2
MGRAIRRAAATPPRLSASATTLLAPGAVLLRSAILVNPIGHLQHARLSCGGLGGRGWVHGRCGRPRQQQEDPPEAVEAAEPGTE